LCHPLSLAFDVPGVFEFVIFIISCVSMADGDGALDVLVPLFPSTSCCLVDGCLLVSLVEVLFTYWCRLVLFRRLFDRWHLMLCLTSFWEFGVPGSFVW